MGAEMPSGTSFSERLAALLGRSRADACDARERRTAPQGIQDDGFSGRLQAEIGRRRTATPGPPPADAESRVVALPGETRSAAAGVELPADLKEVVTSWSSLPPAVRASIVSITRAAKPVR